MKESIEFSAGKVISGEKIEKLNISKREEKRKQHGNWSSSKSRGERQCGQYPVGNQRSWS